MNLHKKEKRDKELLRMEAEFSKTWKLRHSQELIPLDKPIRNGWKKFYVLRDDVTRRDDAQVFHDCLRLVNNVIVCRNKDFKQKVWGKKRWQDMEHPLKTISKEQYEALPASHKKHFYNCQSPWCRKHNWSLRITHYHFAHLHYLETVIKPNYYTHYRPIDGELESIRDRLNNKLHQGGWFRLTRLHGKSVGDRYCRESFKDKINGDIAKREMHTVQEED